jgi:hypothetical protein
MSAFQLAQINIGRILHPLEHEAMRDFVENLDPINALAEQSPGFVWRLQTEEGDATDIRVFEEEDILLNMSVWEDVESLRRFVYQSEHVQFLRRRKEWFAAMKVDLALWWIPAGTLPTPQEGRRRIEILEAQGPTARAFTFSQTFAAGDA